jgi:hypothetical protein
MFTDSEGKYTVGFCMWCGKDFYTIDEVHQHNDNELAECAEFQRGKDTVRMSTPECIPPALQALFDEADKAESEDTE